MEYASPRQRAWAEKDAPDRELIHDRVAGLLLHEKPEGTAIASFRVYPPGEGFDPDPRVVTVEWELSFAVDDASGRGWDWGHEQNELLAERVRAVISAD